MDTAYHMLEKLVGPDEARAVLMDGKAPAWLR
jgi:hypothetical protein